MKIEMRKVKIEEAHIALDILSDARNHQREQGFVQWTDDYPNLKTVLEDINNNSAYFFVKDNSPFGYTYIGFDGEVTYKEIQGNWKSNQPYAVIHRLAFEKVAQGKSLSKDTFQVIKDFVSSKGIHSIRIDTHEENKKMQHILKREGYQYCGIVTIPGGIRLGYELVFDKESFKKNIEINI